jgi:hypothetical protein
MAVLYTDSGTAIDCDLPAKPGPYSSPDISQTFVARWRRVLVRAVLGRETPMSLYRHTANWRFVDKYRNGSAIRHHSRFFATLNG